MNVGDKLVASDWTKWGVEKKIYVVHTITAITPTGRMKTDKGVELNADLTVRGKSGRGYRYSEVTEELQKEMQEQKQRVQLRAQVEKLDVSALTPTEITELSALLASLEARVKGEAENAK